MVAYLLKFANKNDQALDFAGKKCYTVIAKPIEYMRQAYTLIPRGYCTYFFVIYLNLKKCKFLSV